jgi:hypothetical protein
MPSHGIHGGAGVHGPVSTHVGEMKPMKDASGAPVGNVYGSGPDSQNGHPRDLSRGELTGGTPPMTSKVSGKSSPNFIASGNRHAKAE